MWMLVAILTSGNMLAQQVKYAISGSFSENGKMVYLIDKLTEKAIDSVAVADGKFTFSGTADKDALMGVMVGKKSWEIQFFNDGTPVVVNINDSTLTGSPQNERLAKYDVEGYIPMRNLHAKTARMTREEMLAKEDELMDEMNKAIDSEIALANRLFKEERNTLIPVAFAQLYFMDNGLEAYDELVKAQVVLNAQDERTGRRRQVCACRFLGLMVRPLPCRDAQRVRGLQQIPRQGLRGCWYIV